MRKIPVLLRDGGSVNGDDIELAGGSGSATVVGGSVVIEDGESLAREVVPVVHQGGLA